MPSVYATGSLPAADNTLASESAQASARAPVNGAGIGVRTGVRIETRSGDGEEAETEGHMDRAGARQRAVR